MEGNFLFVYPPSFEELRKRIGNRIETEEEFKKRIEMAITEIELANNSVLFTNRLNNDVLEKATDQFYTLIDALYFKEISNFSYGQKQDPLYIVLTTTKFKQPQEIDLDISLEAALADLEKGGAKNMLVKREEFETGKGITGMRAYGEFNLQVSEKKVQEASSQYELLLFAHQDGLQQVLIVHQDDSRFSSGIKKRILDSIELEISESKK